MTIDEIADRLQRLAPCHRRPEYFHEEKSDILAALRQLAANYNRREGKLPSITMSLPNSTSTPVGGTILLSRCSLRRLSPPATTILRN